MANENLSRAVALQALAADVAARLLQGEHADAIRADLLAQGLPEDVVEHVLAVCELAPRPVSRWRTGIAFTLAIVLMIGLPLAGAVGGGWAAATLTTPAAEPERDPETTEREIRCGLGGATKALGDMIFSSAAVFVGLGVGFGLGLAVAFPTVKALSAWSIRGEMDERAGA